VICAVYSFLLSRHTYCGRQSYVVAFQVIAKPAAVNLANAVIEIVYVVSFLYLSTCSHPPFFRACSRLYLIACCPRHDRALRGRHALAGVVVVITSRNPCLRDKQLALSFLRNPEARKLLLSTIFQWTQSATGRTGSYEVVRLAVIQCRTKLFPPTI
jgi:hypothetical protein